MTAGLKLVVQAMLAALPGLCMLLYFVIFTFVIFGVVGNQLWQGVLQGRCSYSHPESEYQMMFVSGLRLTL